MSAHIVPFDGPDPPPLGRNDARWPGAISAVEWTWCLDLAQPFGGLLDVATGLTRMQQRPGEEVETGGPLLNLYLVVCALDQLLSDHLHGGVLDLAPLAGGGLSARVLRSASRLQRAVRLRAPRGGLPGRQREVRRLALALASGVLAGDRAPGREAAAAVARLRAARWPAALARRRLEVPSSFRGADLYPADAELMAGRAAEAMGGGKGPVLVVGLRPSGLYVAALCAAALERRGHAVELLSLRPGVPLLPEEARRVRRLASAGGWALLVDGVGGTGAALRRAVAVLGDLGMQAPRVCAAARDLPERLGGARRARVEAGEWRVDGLLAPESVEEWLNRPPMLERLGADRAAVVRAHRFGTQAELPAVSPLTGRRPGAHALELYEVELVRGQQRWSETLLCRAVGLGFFGYHSWLVAACLGDLVPEPLGIAEGVLLVRWDPGHGEPEPLRSEELEAIAAYAAARSRRLDLGPRREVAAPGAGARQVGRLLARGLGPAAPLAGAWAAEAIERRIGPARHVAVDARMGPSEWVRSPRGGLLKLDFEEHGFDSGNRGVTDPVHDLASAVMGFRLDPDEERELVAAYEKRSGDTGDLDARAAVQKLLVGAAELAAVRTLGLDLTTRAGRTAHAREVVIRETLLSRTVNGFLAAVYLDGVGSDGRGGVWAVDMDQVLERDGMGFECAGRAAGLALRTLLLHGQEVFLASGRSLGEVRERCQTFGLPGGVAEHGAVAWDARRQRAVSLLPAAAL